MLKTIMVALLAGMLFVQAQPDPAMSFDSLDKLRDMARRSTKTGRLRAPLAALLDFDDAVPTRQLSAVRPEGTYYICFGLPWENDNIFFVLSARTRLEIYEADSALGLRGAGVSDAAGGRKVEREAAAAGFQKLLAVWEELASARGAKAPVAAAQCASR